MGGVHRPAMATSAILSAPVAVKPRRARAEPRPLGHRLPYKLGRYTLFDHIGRGGMADIYLASAETSFGGSRLVVIKEVLPEYADRGRFADLLIAEAKLAARLHHANIVQIEDLGREDDTLYIAMEYLEGLDLREVLRRCAKSRVPMPVEYSLMIVSGVLRGLDHAHRHTDAEGRARPVIHRDVSPSNILINFDGETKLCDFGIARAQSDDDVVAPMIEGKAGYMSPEQARGEALDARADVFAAGIILWELLAGRRLYKAEGEGSLLDAASQAKIPPLGSIGLEDEEALFAIVSRALAPSAEDRYGTAAAMLRDLEAYMAGARLIASPLRLGEWMTDNFGEALLVERRSRERAMRALKLGPPVQIVPITAVASEHAEAKADAIATPMRSAGVRRRVLTALAVLGVVCAMVLWFVLTR